FVYHGLFNIPRILITDPRLIQEVLVSGAYNYTKAPRTRRVLGRILGGIGRDLIHLIIAYTRHLGRPIIQGDVHKYQRKMLNPAFSLRYIRDMVPTFFEPVLALRDLWKTEMIGEDSLEVDVLDGMSRATLDIIGLAVTGERGLNVRVSFLKIQTCPLYVSSRLRLRFPSRERRPRETLRAEQSLLGHLQPSSTPYEHTDDVDPSTVQPADGVKLANETGTDNLSKNLIKEARERKKEGNDGKDLLSSLVNEKNEETGEVMSDDDLKAQIMTFLAAGHETTSVSTTWCLYLLAQRPDIQAALRAEIAPLFSNLDRAALPTYDAINSLDLLNRVVKETLRLIPPVPLTTRVNLQDVVLGGYHIPKNTITFIAPAVTQRDERLWGADALEFNPDRWLEEPAKSISPYAYMPFLAGARQCIGNKFALMEMKVLVATMVTAFAFKEKEGWKVTKKQSITWRPHPGMRLVLERP
ncbi:hypothetical protein BC936DRAFT_140679, partial [Jimgerdemannia flammicorona]